MSVAIGEVFGTAMAGKCKERPELPARLLPLEARLSVVPCRGGEAFLRRLFEPLGCMVEAIPHMLDETIALRVRTQPSLATTNQLLNHRYANSGRTGGSYRLRRRGSMKRPTNSSGISLSFSGRQISRYFRTASVPKLTIASSRVCPRQILKKHGLWGVLADRVKHLRERKDVGRAITPEDEAKFIEAAKHSRSPALLPLFVVSVDSGLRASEVRALRHTDLILKWKDGVNDSGVLTVPKSKTDAGIGRAIPLTKRACGILTLWLSRFPEAGLGSYVFPRYSAGKHGNSREPLFYNVEPNGPIGEWKKAWKLACKTAGVRYRWHDCRHTFITPLAENPTVSEETIRALAGHVSKKMLERYSHIRISAKEAAIAGLERATCSVVQSSEDMPKKGQGAVSGTARTMRACPLIR
jgi:integrase